MRLRRRLLDPARSRIPGFLALAAAVAWIGAAACERAPGNGRAGGHDQPADHAPALGPVDGLDLSPTDTGRVGLGDAAPDFTLLDRAGEPVTLSELRGRRVILVFYRGHW